MIEYEAPASTGVTGVVDYADLSSSVQTSLDLADTSLQPEDVTGGTPTFRSVSASTTVADTDDVVQVTGTGSGVVVTLHSAATGTQKVYKIKNSAGGTITFATTSSQTVDGSTTGNILSQDALEVFPDGSNWLVL